ncbi:cryptochrome/deoxyribodipyrimidine photo-lyase family protein [Limnobacter parvus]|uniref:Deoxyribodipyrimidine photo-lyase/cryptochrome family protein n=1 Tax=Limnobacter parvus TaxID=2939690 RepID=A0ABT1XI51_9BURK|nr:cryptochrome/deoxyribodipyrimidine photo-lyase family protein [Limnobacter parvus]MCR2746965.1 deoxyribodipyrimidine photo-lyase/cryptochrome family protein [Limnobacter parvus]
MHLHLVWLKKDIRLSDHAPLHMAVEAARAQGGRVALLYCLEPKLIKQPDSAPQHFEFARECLEALASQLPEHVPLFLAKANALVAFQTLALSGVDQLSLYSHEETGNWASFQRDREIKAWCKNKQVKWHEFANNAVVRRLKNRDEWGKLWLETMRKPVLPVPVFDDLPQAMQFDFPQALHTQLQENGLPCVPLNHSPWPTWGKVDHFYPKHFTDKAHRQHGGRPQAEACLKAFLNERGMNYRFEMSSPLSAESACSRISPYLAFGVVSIREILDMLGQAREQLTQSNLPAKSQTQWRQSLKSFESRLHWHCHFIQKMESEPELEHRSAHRGLNGMRNFGELTAQEQSRAEAWIEGRTGFPMVDACMRMLRATGWVNFRMRAMLVAFASYQLWLDWRHTAPMLAREFLDYEPGIHYPQFQMQSGVTGINTLRIYNPVKQAKDHDPDGVFIRRWIPELKNIPNEWIGEPWNTPLLLQQECGCTIGEDYPWPVVNPDTAIAQARANITEFRQRKGFVEESKRVYEKHGSRNPNRNGTLKRKRSNVKQKDGAVEAEAPDNAQQSLF